MVANFSEPVFVTGTPRVGLAIRNDGSGFNRYADYVGKGSDASKLVFDYKVQQSDSDTNGLGVGNVVLLNGGTIVDAAGHAHVEEDRDDLLALVAVHGARSNSLDGVGPVVQGLAFVGEAPHDSDGDSTPDTYRKGDAIKVAVTFSAAVRVVTNMGTPSLGLRVGSTTRQAVYASGSGTATLTFTYTVAADDEDADGVSVPAGSIRANGARLDDLVGGKVGFFGDEPLLGHDGIAADASRKVDGLPVKVTGLAFTGAPLHDTNSDSLPDTYRTNETLSVAATFERAVTVSTTGGKPSLGLLVGSTTRQAAYVSGSGTTTLVFSYSVAAGETDTDGVSVPAGSIALNGGTLKDAENNDVALAHDALDADASRKVDGTTTPARIEAMTRTGDLAPHDSDGDGTPDTYRAGDTIGFFARFDRAVTVETGNGVPSLALQVGSKTRQAPYVSGFDQHVRFDYTFVAGDLDADGVSIPAGSIALNGGRIGDSGGTATLTHGGLAADAARKVEAVAPAVSGLIRFRFSPRRTQHGTGIFYAGDVIRFTATFSEPVLVSGTTQVGFNVGAGTWAGSVPNRHANYVGKTGPSTLVFEYTVQAADSDNDGFVYQKQVALNGGAIRDAVGNTYVRTDSANQSTSHQVDGSKTGGDNAGPVVRSIAFAGGAPHDTDNDSTPDTYGRNDAIEVAVTFSEAVTVDTENGTPSLGLEVGSRTVQASYASGTGTAGLVFSYAVQAGDEDTDGVSVPAGSILLNGGTLKDEADNAAALYHDAVARDANRKVADTTARVTGIAFAGEVPHDVDGDGDPETYRRNDKVSVAVTFTEEVAVDTGSGTPSLGLLVGSNTRQGSYISGSGTATLVFSYAVAESDIDTDGVSVPAGSIALNGGTIEDADGDAAALLAHGAVAADATRIVDGTLVPPALTGLAFTGAALRDADGDETPETYRAGDVITVEATFDRAVTVEIGNGTPSLALQVGSKTREAAYASGTGTATLVFSYTVAGGDLDADGVSVAADAVSLGGGRIGDSAGTATLTHDGLAADAARKVDAVAPAVSGLIRFRFSPRRTQHGTGIFYAGDVIRFTATFSEPVLVSGTPQVGFNVGAGTWAGFCS